MTTLIVLAVLSVFGIGVVFWLLKNEQESERAPLLAEKPSENISQPQAFEDPRSESNEPEETSVERKRPLGFLKDVLKKLPFGKKDSGALPQITRLSSLNDYIEDEQTNTTGQKVITGTSSLTTSPPDERPSEKEALTKADEEKIEKEIDLSNKFNELKTKYQKLEVLFAEKNAELENTSKSLDNELRNRKEFNKVKDLLEKELKDVKDRAKNIQGECDVSKMEGESQKRRISQLEDKVTKLEKDLLEKEDKVNELVKRLQTFASPSMASTPPKPETIPEPVVPEGKEAELPRIDTTLTDAEEKSQPYQLPPIDEKKRVIEIIDSGASNETLTNNEETASKDNNKEIGKDEK